MYDAPTHTHVDIPKCPSYDGRHEYFVDEEDSDTLFPVESFSVDLVCVYCPTKAKAYYKLVEIVEG